jgi:protein tyrosine/serine phosphatase
MNAKKALKTALALLLALLMLMGALAGCRKKEGKLTTGELGVIKDEEFGNIYFDLTIEEFNALGFAFGDSVDIEFDNGKSFKDVPYYSGYYVPVGEMLVCGYPGYPHPVIAENYGAGTWEGFGVSEDTKVTLTLNEKAKYIDVQELFALSYSDERKDFDSDIIFANFREVKGGNLKEGAFYRSASPCDDQHCRAAYANALAEEYGIRFALDLSDNEEKYASYVSAEGFASQYYDSLYREGNVKLLAMNANYRSDAFAKTISGAFLEMTRHECPCLIHCVEGKDRTGFVCTLLLALAGASAQEIIDDYMITYANYYGVTKEKKPEKYNAILGNVYDFLYCLCGAEKGTALDTLDLKAGAESYLERGGLTADQIAAIERYITK